ncbi:MAG: hypothetical protein JKY08_01455 [Flavobacteriaceae bacterium]|nr:hypothetical protein [Flavobacteriaceae bacterium]
MTVFNNKWRRNSIGIILLLTVFISCSDSDNDALLPMQNSTVNFNHFNYLYQDFSLNGVAVGVVNIYSEYPNYNYAIEPNEGFTCVDDVARAIVLLTGRLEGLENPNPTLDKIKKLTEFVLQMQHENGYFNNFVWRNGSINTTYKTSVANLNWWSLRALWSLETVLPVFESDTAMEIRIKNSIDKVVANIVGELPSNNSEKTVVNGVELPTWLPQQYASDQASLLMLGLLKNYRRNTSENVKLLIESLADGIMLTQKGGKGTYPNGAFMSWANLWHAWGNNQSYALLLVGEYFNNQTYIDSALKEVDNLYPLLLKNGFMEAFYIQKSGSVFIEKERKQFPQIAYGLRPMVFATYKAYDITGESKYLDLATNLSAWLYGENDAYTSIYNPESGICFDGIVGTGEVNRNSGAESTIESLFILQHIENRTN